MRSSPIRALKSDDLPTFGLPRIATRIASPETAGRDSPTSSSRSDDLVEQIAGARAVHTRDRQRVAEPEPVELERERFLRRVVDLVREHEHRLVRETEDRRELLVARRDARPRIDDEEDEVGLRHRDAGLVDDRAGNGVLARDIDAAGVDQQEPLAGPVADELLAVAGRAARLVDDRGARRGEAVDQRGLADVRVADDRDRAQKVRARQVGVDFEEGFVVHSGGTRFRGRPRA